MDKPKSGSPHPWTQSSLFVLLGAVTQAGRSKGQDKGVVPVARQEAAGNTGREAEAGPGSRNNKRGPGSRGEVDEMVEQVGLGAP